MSQELTFKAKDFLTLQNFQNVINIINGHMDRVKPIFEDTFKTENRIKDYRTTDQIIKFNRMIFFLKDVLGESKGSELAYGFICEKPSIYVAIWLPKEHDEYKNIDQAVAKYPEFYVNKEIGVLIEMEKDISAFLNDDEADTKTADWYKYSFNKFANLIRETPELNWKIKV